MSSAGDENPGQRIWWLFAGAILAIGLVSWLTLWGAESPEQAPFQEMPGADPAPAEEEIEKPDGPLERPPGTAPADPRRPATVPYDGSSEKDGDGSEEETHSELVPEEVSPDAEVDRRDEEARTDRRDERWSGVAKKLRERQAEERSEDQNGDDADENGDEGERQSAIIEAQGEPAVDGDERSEGPPETDTGWYEDGEWVEGEEQELAESEEYDGDEADREAEEFAEGEERVDSGEWEEEPYDEAGDEAPNDSGSNIAGGGDIAVSDNISDHQGTSSPTTGGATSQSGDLETLDELEDRPPSDEALQGYREHLDEAGIPAPEDAGLYSAVATQELADVLYLLSAGRTLPSDEAARQRDDLIDSTTESTPDDDELAEDDQLEQDVEGDGEAGAEDEEPPPFDEDWTAWIDAADWLRLIQEEEYPELAHLVDEVEEAAALIDPEMPEEEQVDELVDFFEAVEVVLEAMAIEDSYPPQGDI